MTLKRPQTHVRIDLSDLNKLKRYMRLKKIKSSRIALKQVFQRARIK